jgi:kynurenine formamidase
MQGGWLEQFHRLGVVVPNELITKHEIVNPVNLDFTDRLKDKVSEFVDVFAPLRIKGGTGSPGRLIAIG